MGDGRRRQRQEMGDKRQKTRDEREKREMGDDRRKIVKKSHETRDKRQ